MLVNLHWLNIFTFVHLLGGRGFAVLAARAALALWCSWHLCSASPVDLRLTSEEPPVQ